MFRKMCSFVPVLSSAVKSSLPTLVWLLLQVWGVGPRAEPILPLCSPCCLAGLGEVMHLNVGTDKHQRGQNQVHRAQETCRTRAEAGETELLSQDLH